MIHAQPKTTPNSKNVNTQTVQVIPMMKITHVYVKNIKLYNYHNLNVL